ncbi:helix-turn-helix transcriptional regulator [uncultured Tenacibaculum sp.]|uniref:helix-turn-helix domain-containing protein n=1 Tax=uncultured Tenacibaculum sp. TaxID=174713 RepID=UPI002635C1E4|nr:helix-turn-helix transcriptional regulator [uncultured Tenacibaculum sp.]
MKVSTENNLKLVLKKIKEERIKREMSQYDFGEKIGLSQNAYFKVETGKTKLDLFRFLTICKVLEMDPKSFF